jgi:hypothetical protein
MSCKITGVAVLALVLSGCGTASIKRSELETQTQRALTKSVGKQAPKAVCPDELEAKKGAETRCHMDFPESKRLGITVTVSAVDGDKARFAVAADDKLTRTP